jgi:hypothetical protein
MVRAPKLATTLGSCDPCALYTLKHALLFVAELLLLCGEAAGRLQLGTWPRIFFCAEPAKARTAALLPSRSLPPPC